MEDIGHRKKQKKSDSLPKISSSHHRLKEPPTKGIRKKHKQLKSLSPLTVITAIALVVASPPAMTLFN